MFAAFQSRQLPLQTRVSITAETQLPLETRVSITAEDQTLVRDSLSRYISNSLIKSCFKRSEGSEDQDFNSSDPGSGPDLCRIQTQSLGSGL